MARKPKNGHANGETHEEPPPVIEEAAAGESSASNCTDETKREFYRKALIAKIALESAQAAAKQKNGEYRNILKDAKKAGIDPDAITATLAARFQDEDVLVLKLREHLKMLDLGGVVPNVVDKILSRLHIEEPTANEAHQISIDRAYDDGAFSGREGDHRENNPHVAGSDLYDAWDRGWLVGQQAIADEMTPRPPMAMPEPPAMVQ